MSNPIHDGPARSRRDSAARVVSYPTTDRDSASCSITVYRNKDTRRLRLGVVDRRDKVLVTRNGKPAAALIPIGEYEALEEPAEILPDRDAIAAIEAGLAELEHDERVALDLRRELAERRPSR